MALASDIPPPREVVDVAALVRQLGSEDFQEREAATEKLSGLVVDEPPAELLAALKSPNPEVRDRAAKAVKAIRDRAALRRLPSDQQFATRGQVDLFVAATVRLDLKPEDERLWLSAFNLGKKAVTLAKMEGDRQPRGPTAFRDFATYLKSNSEFVRIEGTYTRPDKVGKEGLPLDIYPVAVQAAGVKGEYLVGLIVSRGPVSVKTAINDSLILATGDVTVGSNIYGSVIICDGDVLVPDRPDNVVRCLIITRGKIEVKGSARASTLIAGQTVTVAKLPPQQQRPIAVADPNDPWAVIRMRQDLADLESVRVEIKEKNRNALSFITFFELSRVGLEVKAADGAVKVAAIAAKTPSEKAGVKVGDTILEVNGKKPTDAESLRRLLRDALAVGDATVKLQRGDKTETAKVSLPE